MYKIKDSVRVKIFWEFVGSFKFLVILIKGFK